MLGRRAALAFALTSIALLLASLAALPALASGAQAPKRPEQPMAVGKSHKAPAQILARGTIEASTIDGIKQGQKAIVVLKLAPGKKGVVAFPGNGTVIVNITDVKVDRSKGTINVSATVLRSKVSGISKGDSLLLAFKLTGLTLKDETKLTGADIALVMIEAKIPP